MGRFTHSRATVLIRKAAAAKAHEIATIVQI
jgi:hypothetical protein